METLGTDPNLEPAFQIGDIIRHVASHNRYQEYQIIDRVWNPEAVMGVGGYEYIINYRVWDSSRQTNLIEQKRDWKIPEVTLPIHNIISW